MHFNPLLLAASENQMCTVSIQWAWFKFFTREKSLNIMENKLIGPQSDKKIVVHKPEPDSIEGFAPLLRENKQFKDVYE